MRIAALADLHFTPAAYEGIKSAMERVRDEADVLILAGDLTNYGKASEMEPLLNVLVRLRLPVIAVLGNHDYESGQEAELMKMMTDEGIKLLDGTAYERDGVGFAGTKGFIGGFGRGILTAFGEPEIKRIVQASIDEALKLERAMSQLRTEKRVVVLHYSPVVATVTGEPAEIFPYLGTSRLAEVVDRHGANLIVHGHAHNGGR
jgi:Icc-related predicted phosphoesterase